MDTARYNVYWIEDGEPRVMESQTMINVLGWVRVILGVGGEVTGIINVKDD